MPRQDPPPTTAAPSHRSGDEGGPHDRLEGGSLFVRNWRRWQTYRSDRGQPPWIKVYRALLRDPAFVSLTDAQRGQLVVMWLLAADRDGVIPASPRLLQKLCFMDAEPDLEVFVQLGFLEWRQGDANMTPPRRQSDRPEAEAEAETEAETEAEAESARATMLSKVQKLYGWQGSEGTDTLLMKAFDDPEKRDVCLRIAVARLVGEERAYQGRLFRRTLQSVIEEQSENGRGDKWDELKAWAAEEDAKNGD